MRRKVQICRLCMGCKNVNEEVFDKQIYIKIRECLQVEIDPDDENLPITICTYCISTVRKFHRFRKECWKVQRLLISNLRHRDFIQIVNVTNINLPVFEDIALAYERKRKRTVRPVKKEMIVEIQEVVRVSPPDSTRTGKLHGAPDSLYETNGVTPVAKANRSEETRRVTVETQSLEKKATETPTPEMVKQATESALTQTVAKEPKAIGLNLASVRPEGLEREPFEADDFDAGCVKLKPESLENGAMDSETLECDALKAEAAKHDALDPKPLAPEALEPEALEPQTLEPEALEPEALGTEALEPEALEPEVLEPEALESDALESDAESLQPEALEPEALDPDVLDTDTWETEMIEPECLQPEILKSPDINTELFDTESHLMPHDYTTKQASGTAADSPKTRPRPRRRRTNISGKALYKSLLMACDTCGKMIERNRMEGHRNKHLGIRPYTCPHEACDAAFHCKHARRLHVRCRHGNESFSCDVCGKVYRARRDLLGHQREAHSEPKFECDICAKKFTTRSRLKQHRFYHTGERNHPCALCPMTFFNNFQLKVHMRTHTQARPFVCKVCKKAFRYRHMAKDHIVRQHGIAESLEKDWIINHPEPDIRELLSKLLDNSNVENAE